MKIEIYHMNSIRSLILTLFVAWIAAGSVSAQICAIPPLGMVSWWSGDDTANDVQAGQAGLAGNDGILQNGATFDAGFVDAAFALDGIDDFVEVSHAVELDITNALTLDAWIQTNDAGVNQMIVSKAVPGGSLLDINYYFGILTSRLAFAVTGNEIQQGDTPLLSNTWYHVAVTYDGAEVRFYLNGVLDGVRALTTVPLANVAALEIGRFGLRGTSHFNGLIDEVELFDRALSDLEVEAIAAASRVGKCKIGETCEMRTDYEAGGCSGIFQVFSADDLGAYVASNFGKNEGESFQHLKIVGDLTHPVLDIESPCRITLAADVRLSGDVLSLDGRKGVIDTNGYTMNAKTACVLSEEGSAQLGNGSMVNADNLTITGAKMAAIGRNATIAIAEVLTMVSTGNFRSSEAVIEAESAVTAGTISLSAPRGAHLGDDTTIDAVAIALTSTGAAGGSDAGLRTGARVTASDLMISASGLAKVGQHTRVSLTGSLGVASTGRAGGSLAIVQAGAEVSVGGDVELVSGNKATIAKDTIVNVLGTLHMEAEALNKCTVMSSATVTFGAKSGSCAPLLP